MQVANGGGGASSESAAASAASVGVGNGNDELSDLSTNSNVVQSSQVQQQQQLRQTSTSPGQQQQQHQQQHSQHHASHNPNAVSGLGTNSNQTISSGGGVHHHHVSQSGGGGGYHHHQRHAQSYHHNQQQQHHHMQHYHHHHQNKYNHNNPRGGDNGSNVNHVLLITVMNPHYTINCDLIHQICSTYGKVNRIVIFKKNGVQAMVEFDNVESAKRAKSTLNGCDVYSGCCTLKIEFAKPTRLNIHKNDNESFDYTNPNLGSGGPPAQPLAQQQHQPPPNSDGVIDETGMNEQAQPSSHPQPVHHSMQQHSPHGHHHRGEGGARGGSGAASGHNQHDGQHHFHHQSQPSNPQHHVQSAIPSHVAAQPGAAGSYGMATSIDHSNNSAETFHQDGGFNVSRGGDQPAAAYVGVSDSYIPAHEGPPTAHGGLQHGNMYSRHAGQHQHHHQQQHQHHHHHHQQHHTHSGGPNHNNMFSPGNASNSLMSGPSNLGQPQGAVMMVYGLQPERVNCDRLFNLFCLYGNVVRVGILA